MKFQVTLEQIESGQARLLIRPQETQEILWPADCLPSGSEEGDILTIEIAKDEAQTREAQERVKGLLNKLLEKGRK
ncbi:MAG: DUF3006 domain-containing protein [Firmicutes bacterium]|nr:DUF3006 domain-containing protein [Bacillota bacterium]